MPASAQVRRVLLGLRAASRAVVAAKLVVALGSGSLAVLGSAVDSGMDALSNVLALTVVRVAAKEPDEDHPYGHSKFETLGALAIVGFLSISCFELVRGAVNHLTGGARRVEITDMQLALLLRALCGNVLIAWYEQPPAVPLTPALLTPAPAHTPLATFFT